MPATIETALQLHKAGRLDQAESLYWQLVQHNPFNASALHLLGVVALQRQQFQRSVELIKKALALNANAPEFHHNIGAAYRVLGDFTLAEQHYRRALQLKPDYAEAYFNLSAVRKFSPEDSVLPLMEAQLQRTGWNDDDRCFLHFAAGKLYDDMGRYDDAFAHYTRGNAARGAHFNIEQHREWVEAIIAHTPRSRLEAMSQEGLPDETPVFIVGMPRSGTTLVEQILASHPQVCGAGELPDIARIAATVPQHVPSGARYPQFMEELTPHVASGFGEAYVRRLRSFDATAARVVDKLPLNFLYLGLIAAMLPRARVIHTIRHPLDTCLSCYFQKFRTGQEYSYSLSDLALYYREYRRLLDHWNEVLPLPMYHLRYEELLSDQQRVSHELIDFVGLEWNDACLAYHEAERPVTTASNWQVRRPLDPTRRERWRRYEAHLQPLIAELAEFLPAEKEV